MTKIAAKLAISKITVHARAKKLKDEGVVEISSVIFPETLPTHLPVAEQPEEIFEIVN
ncbi:MAG: winged helix-turn-helix transcriptional regulator [Deltaproteobacteria bacterium]|nr:winged helix-turn-helix transcriptional regulator [Deltaproteobacteria bacterium]